ncbi:GNAT family N-acetyltransferase [Rubrivivax albus]|uniref:GNAT family N-acetyltransferase n=1 Tax=Rubrivivax albus TaxID=2499835 RepID=A0A3S2UKG7_9BURK|nr:GNAT family N-acetyltransferase [Rubrivivax albus]RVT47485.1 GNAT family N-acetyltransferase [Rubrivivax albus]
MTSPPALAYASEHQAEEFAAAAARSKSLHRSWVHPPTDTAAARALLLKRQGPADFGYVIYELDSRKIAGFIEITNIVRGNFQSAYLGFYMFKGYERRGYMNWALGEMVRRSWQDLKLHRLEANIQPGNTASIGLVSKLGFVKEGFSSRYLKIGARWRDHERWAIVAK